MQDNLFFNRYRLQSARAAWHAYNGGMYFVTICTKNREHYFGEIENGEIHLSEIGEYTQICIQHTHEHNPYAEIPLWVVMPNHIHAIVLIDGDKIPYDKRTIKTTNGGIVETFHETSLQTVVSSLPLLHHQRRSFHRVAHVQGAVHDVAAELDGVVLRAQVKTVDGQVHVQVALNRLRHVVAQPREPLVEGDGFKFNFLELPVHLLVVIDEQVVVIDGGGVERGIDVFRVQSEIAVSVLEMQRQRRLVVNAGTLVNLLQTDERDGRHHREFFLPMAPRQQQQRKQH